MDRLLFACTIRLPQIFEIFTILQDNKVESYKQKRERRISEAMAKPPKEGGLGFAEYQAVKLEFINQNKTFTATDLNTAAQTVSVAISLLRFRIKKEVGLFSIKEFGLSVIKEIIKDTVSNYPNRDVILKTNFEKYVDVILNARYSLQMNTEQEAHLFSKYHEAGQLLGLTNLEAKYFAGKVLGFERSELVEVTGRNNKNVDALKHSITRKLNAKDKIPSARDSLIEKLAKTIIQPDSIDAARKFFNGDIDNKIKVVEEYQQNKQIADLVRNDPELMAQVEQKLLAQQQQKADAENLEELLKLSDPEQDR